MSHHPGTWKLIYNYLSDLPSGSFIGWDHLGEVTNSPDLRKSRGAITRARQEMETQQGRTLRGQNAVGFTIEVMA